MRASIYMLSNTSVATLLAQNVTELLGVPAGPAAGAHANGLASDPKIPTNIALSQRCDQSLINSLHFLDGSVTTEDE